MSILTGSEDTIVALATPVGRSALAVIRLSGAGAHEIVGAVLRPRLSSPRHATRVRIEGCGGVLIDDAIGIRYDAPRSYTGENAVELISHGGLVTPSRIVAALIAHGARPALQGEFTRRAVVNGKLDILQAEAINDLINAESSCGAQLALAQLEGGLSRRVTHLRAEILELEALITYEMDFPDEDDGPIATEKIRAAAARVASSLRSLIGTAPVGEIVRTGATVVIAGVPNVGKSSLFNSLIGHQRAIVADVPGTTRDALEAVLDASPYPLRLVDTAGIRETGDFIDRLGIEVSRDYIKRADVVLACGDSTANVGIAVDASRVVSKAPIVRVRTKSDLLNQRDLLESEQLEEIGVSATTGKGLGKLINHVEQILGRNDSPLKLDAPIVARARYRDALARACNEVAGFQKVRETPGMPAVVAAVHLREAVRALEELIGVVDVEEILAGVFSRFCVGK